MVLVLKRILLLLVIYGLVGGANTLAQDGDEEAAPPATQSTYISLKPPFVANYGGTGKLKFLRAEIALRIDSFQGTGQVRHHMPAIRNAIVTILSKQMEENVSSMEGKELLRVELLEAVREVIVSEEDSHSVSDLLFNAFIVQS